MQELFSEFQLQRQALLKLEGTHGAYDDKHVSMSGDFSLLLFSPEMNCCKMESEAPSTINLTLLKTLIC